MFSPLPDGKIRLDEDLVHYVWIADGVEIKVRVPAGFESDGASIPPFFWPLIGPPIGAPHLIPAVIHDFLCVRAFTYPHRLITDAIFFALLREHNVPYWKRCVLYLAVRFFGRFVWAAGRKKCS